jgi:RNA polymerase sigma factor (sigma-70 family)
MSGMDTAKAPLYFSEEAWIDDLKQGNELAWELLMARYAPALRQAIGQMLSKRGMPLDLREDIEGETWITAVRRIESFAYEGEDKLRRWLHKIAFHHVQSFTRLDRHMMPSFEEVQARGVESEFALDFFLFANNLMEVSAEEEVLLMERLEDLDAALQTLNARDREILLAMLMEDVDRETLALRYGLKEDSVSQIIWRAKSCLRARLNVRYNARGGEENERRHYG